MAETRRVTLEIDSQKSIKQTRTALSQLQKDLRKTLEKTYELDIDESNFDDLVKDIKKFPDKLETGLDFDTSELDKALSEIKAFPDSINSKLGVDTSEIDSAARKADRLEGTKNAKVKVDDSAISSACKNIENEIENCVKDGVESGISGADVGGLLADAGVGFGIGASIREGLEGEARIDLLAASTGVTEADARRLGEVANNAYLEAWGENRDEVTQVLAEAFESKVIRDFSSQTNAELQTIATNALDLQKVMGEDFEVILQSVGQLMKTGLVSDAQTAFDLIAQAQQSGGNVTGELLDTINEYSVNFKEAGISAEQFFGGIVQVANSGAFTIDKFGDAVKESRIAMNDLINNQKELDNVAGRLGLTSESLGKLLNDAADGNSGAFFTLASAVKNVGDEADQLTAIEAIFGSPGEDLSATTLELINFGNELENVDGSMQQLSTSLNDNTLTSLEEARRKFGDLFVQLGTAFLPVLEALLPVFVAIVEGISGVISTLDQLGLLTPIVTALGAAFAAKSFLRIAGIANNLLSLGSSSGVAGKGITSLVTKLVPFGSQISKLGPQATKLGPSLVKGFGSIAAKVAPILAKLALSLGPAGLIAIAVAGLAILIFKNWDKIKAFLGKAWDFIKNAASKFIAAFKKIFLYLTPAGLLAKLIFKNFDSIKAFFSKIWNGIKAVFSTVLNAISTVVKTYINIYKTIITTAWNVIKAVTSTVWNGIKASISFVLDAIKLVVDTTIGFIKKLFDFKGLASSVSAVFNRVKDALIAPIQAAWERIKGIVDKIKGAFDSVKGGGVPFAPGLAIGGTIKNGIPSYAAGGVDHKRVGRGRVTNKFTYMTSELGHTEAILPEAASIQRIESILGRTNILKRLYSSFSDKLSKGKIGNINASTTSTTVDKSRVVRIAPQVYITDSNNRGSEGERRLAARQIGDKVANAVFRKSKVAIV